MANQLAKYIVQLEAQTAQYERKLAQANGKLTKFTKSQTTSLDRLAGSFRGLIPAVTLVGLAAVAKRSIDTADNLNKLVDRLGGTTEAFSELGFVAERGGLQFRTLELGLQRMSRRVAEAAQGTGEAKGALRELGFDAAALAKLPIDKQFEAIAEQLSKVESSADKTRLAMKLFDSEGVALLQVMKDGAGGIQLMREKARDLGVTLDTETARKATAAKDAMTDFNAKISSTARNLTLEFAPVLTDMIGKLERFAIGVATAFGITEAFPLQDEIEATEAKLAKLVRDAERAQKSFLPARSRDSQSVIDARLNEILDVSKALDALKQKQIEILTGPPAAAAPIAGGINIMDNGKEAAAQAEAELEAFRRKYEQIEATVARNLAELEKWKGALSPEEFKRIGDAMRFELVDGIEEVTVKIKKFEPLSKKAFDEMAALSDQAARNMQDAFADFLFDPFEDGLKGMLKSFVDTLRRMVANQLALQIFGSFGGTSGVGSAIKGIFGRAGGGPVRAGQPYIVGERGPELFVPQASGNITPNGKMGGSSFNFYTTIESGGGNDPQKLLPLLEARDRKLKGELVDELNRGIYA